MTESQPQFDAVIPLPIVPGNHQLGIQLSTGGVRHLEILQATRPFPAASPQASLVVQELENYFADPRHVFRVPLALAGSAFQQRVWAALQQIPAGQVASYGELAQMLGTSARAVGNACRRNPVAIIVPCHRVVSRSGIGGYSGQVEGEQIALKRALLSHESR